MPDDNGALREATAACPKHMTYGPCGGVGFDGSCEIDAELACPFVPLETVRFARAEAQSGAPVGLRRDASADGGNAVGSTPARSSAGAEMMRALISARRIIVADFPARALDAASIRECAAALAGSVDAVLSGDSGQDRVQFSPTYRARLIHDAGLMPWNGVNCRDRNRVALEGELAGLADVGTGGVHCVTGDHTQTGSRPDAMPVFDLDSTELAALARAAGHLVSVGESPTTPPVDKRAARLLEKERAGAELCFVNHCGGAEPVAEFIAAARALGSQVGFIPCIPIVLDEGSANLLRSFTTLVLPPGYLDGILAAPGAREAGIDAAVALSMMMLQLDGVVGVNLSGGAAPGAELEYASAVAEIGRRLEGALPYPSPR